MQDKNIEIENLTAAFKGAQAAFLLDYRGLDCATLTKFRADLRGAGARLRVSKNTLAKRAVAGTDFEKLGPKLKGPTAVIWADEPVSVAKVVAAFVKDKENISVKAGVVEGALLDAKGVEALSKLPSRPEVLSQLLGLLNAPATKLLRTINEPSSQLVRLLEAHRKQIEEKAA